MRTLILPLLLLASALPACGPSNDPPRLEVPVPSAPAALEIDPALTVNSGPSPNLQLDLDERRAAEPARRCQNLAGDYARKSARGKLLRLKISQTDCARLELRHDREAPVSIDFAGVGKCADLVGNNHLCAVDRLDEHGYAREIYSRIERDAADRSRPKLVRVEIVRRRAHGAIEKFSAARPIAAPERATRPTVYSEVRAR